MMDVSMIWNSGPEIACSNFSKDAVSKVLEVPGSREFRAHANTIGSPHVRATYVWQGLEKWANIQRTDGRQVLMSEFRKYIRDVDLQLSGYSPALPESRAQFNSELARSIGPNLLS